MKKYYGLDWLRAVCCIGIMLMHVATNTAYPIDGFLYRRLIPSFTDMVYLFMALSAFGMCCGYLDKVMTGRVDWTSFYKKRYVRILPFFLFLILVDLVINFSVTSVWEGLAELTLLHGLIPRQMSVIGVGWFLGTVFVFYLIFPFFCVLIGTKKRAWCAFAAAIVLNYICAEQFGLDRSNFASALCYFLAGGLVYLYRDKLGKLKWYVYLPVCLAALAAYYLLGVNVLTRLFVTVAVLAFAVSGCGKKVPAVSFVSDISMEFYLSHMVIFRVVERLGLHTRFGSGWGQYLITAGLVAVGTVMVSFLFQKAVGWLTGIWKRKAEEVKA